MEQTAIGYRVPAIGIRIGAVVLGAVLVALAAQVSVPLPGTPVPMTLQPMAVLLVGGLLGARLGALSMILYLAMGAAGLPVFTPSPLLLPGIARLFGQTGGYLLAYPIAAYAVGWFSDPARKRGVQEQVAGVSVNPGLAPGVSEPWVRMALGVFIGLVLIHLGGLAQLAILTGNLSAAARFGTWPFLLGDMLKLVILVPVLTKLIPTVRARL
jgi:biotin transport system substrate-specific component